MSTWKCLECGETTEWSMQDVSDSGTPVCAHCDCDMELDESLEGWVKIGTFGVDSGQVLITDPCYLHDWKVNEFEETAQKEMQKSGKFEYSYNGACARTLLSKGNNRGAGSIGLGCDGVVSSTGFGDGEYPVFALYEEGRVKEIKIKFF